MTPPRYDHALREQAGEFATTGLEVLWLRIYGFRLRHGFSKEKLRVTGAIAVYKTRRQLQQASSSGYYLYYVNFLGYAANFGKKRCAT
jgi:hypothetical protein